MTELTPGPALLDTADVGEAGNVGVEATFPVEHACLFRDEQDIGTVTLRWRTGTDTLELHALRDYVHGWRNIRISHEEFTYTVYEHLNTFLGLSVVSVETVWKTAGGVVTCRYPSTVIVAEV